MTSDAHRRFITSAPARDGLARLALTVGGAGARVVRVRRLRGGVDAATHAVEIDPYGWVVLKRTWPTGLRSATEEFQRLAFASRIAVPTPEPLALDAAGDWFGRPALVLSLMPGRPRWHDGAGVWLTQLAEAAAAIHATAVPRRVPAALRQPHTWQVWRPPPADELRRTARLDAVIGAATSLQRDLQARPPVAVVNHHDLHWRNVAWRRGRVSAVLDWNEARLGPAASDVAYCSVDLALSHGVGVARQFVDRYRLIAAGESADLVRWQLLWIAIAAQWIRYWQLSFDLFGLGLSPAVLRRRLAAFADHLLTGGPGGDAS